MNKFVDFIAVVFLKLLAALPFPLMYLLSDCAYFLVYRLMGYRKKVVFQNLRNAFPEKPEAEIGQIARKYYHHLCDIMLESVKLHHMSAEEMDKHLIIKGIEKTEAYFQQGKSFILLGMHYNNWEWCSSMQRHSSHQVVIVYSPVRDNQKIERFLLDSREKFGSETIPMHHTARRAMSFDQERKPGCLFLAADQTSSKNSPFWTCFLHQETPFFFGPAKIARKTNQPLFYLNVVKQKRGIYEARLEELVAEPARHSAQEMELIYIDKIEQIIREKPEYWLWSHRRWKHQRPEGKELIPRNH